MSELYETSDSPRVTRAVQWLLALNIGVYFLQLTLFGSDAVYSALALDPARFPGDWWTVITYMFDHAWLAHLAFNMFTLWMFGPRLEHEWGTRTFVWFYLCAGVGGAVAHLIFAPHTSVIGASGAISGVLVAYALRWPDEEVYLFGVIPMRSRWVRASRSSTCPNRNRRKNTQQGSTASWTRSLSMVSRVSLATNAGCSRTCPGSFATKTEPRTRKSPIAR